MGADISAVEAYIRVSHITHRVGWLVGLCFLASFLLLLLFCYFGFVVVVLVCAAFQDILFVSLVLCGFFYF